MHTLAMNTQINPESQVTSVAWPSKIGLVENSGITLADCIAALRVQLRICARLSHSFLCDLGALCGESFFPGERLPNPILDLRGGIAYGMNSTMRPV
ncbi:MAG: hypothetical protein WBG50_01655, partial [Desulfomonilaceae bacterium]